MVDFFKLLTPKRQEEIAAGNEFYAERLEMFKALDTKNLITSTKYYVSQMDTPRKYKPGVPVYDATFWHIILPELLRRLEDD
ncbi:MAG TPA: hypothetical protein VMW10_11100 [Alphaproteobacteria bacterium]|nr:hypothetical protein [Alphaproteobacteria bacterium]